MTAPIDGPISGDERKASEGRSSSSRAMSAADGLPGDAKLLTTLSSGVDNEYGVLFEFVDLDTDRYNGDGRPQRLFFSSTGSVIACIIFAVLDGGDFGAGSLGSFHFAPLIL